MKIQPLPYQLWEIIIDSLHKIDDKFCQSMNPNKSISNEVLNNFSVFARDLLNVVYNDINKWTKDETDSKQIMQS